MIPILYSFRRCPYAMRAHLAIAASGVVVETREILLCAKPADFLAASPSATVPCLVTQDRVIDESLDIMLWALERSDPEGWLKMPRAGYDWIARNDGPFKYALDRVKYASRHPEACRDTHLQSAMAHLKELETCLDPWLFGRPTLADFAMLPFIRQFAHIDKDWFNAQPLPQVQAWLASFLRSERFVQVMEKRPIWAAPETGHPLP